MRYLTLLFSFFICIHTQAEEVSPSNYRLLFIGDSITDMGRDRRKGHWDQNHILGHSYVFMLAGRMALDAPSTSFHFINRGIGGNRLSDLKQRWQEDAIAEDPDLLTVFIGINDVSAGLRNPTQALSAEAFELDYRALLDSSKKQNPDLRIVLIDPFSLPSGNLKEEGKNDAYQEKLKQYREVITRLAQDYDALHLKTQDLFNASSLQADQLAWDGIHPLPAGHELIARHWHEQVLARWKSFTPRKQQPASPPWGGKSSEWHGYKRFDFEVDGRACFVVVPQKAAEGTPWVWRARFPTYHIEADLLLLERGFHIAHMDTGGMLGSPQALDHWDEFYAHMTEQGGLSPKVALEAVSRGGLFAYRWAARHPTRIACIYADTPVCDFKSWPLGQGSGKGAPSVWKDVLREYALTEEEALSYKENPIEILKPIAAEKIPLLHIVSLNDLIVPPAENTFILAERYRALGGEIEVMEVKHGPRANGHHFDHPNPKKVADFIEGHCL